MNKKEKGKSSSRGKGKQAKITEREEARYGSRKTPHSMPPQASDSKGNPRHQRAAPQAGSPSRHNQGLGSDQYFQPIYSPPLYSPALGGRNSAVSVPSSSPHPAGGHPAFYAAAPSPEGSGTYYSTYRSDSVTYSSYGSNTSSYYGPSGYHPGTTSVQPYAAVPPATNRTTPHNIQSYPGMGDGLNAAHGSGVQGHLQYSTRPGFNRRHQGEPLRWRSEAVDPGPPIFTNGRDSRGPDGATLFVFHIPNDMTNYDLFQLFQHYGTILSVKIMTEYDTGRGRGFGFVSYDSVESAASAINNLNGFEVSPIRALLLLLILLHCSTQLISLLARFKTKG